jgi:hypothetical protein
MNILCLGCSWTAGINAQPYNWVEALAKITPEHTFYNFALCGSSLLHSIWILETTLKQQWDIIKIGKIDKVIFQVTNEGRLTYYKNLDNVRLADYVEKSKTISNYNILNLPWQQICQLNYGVLHPENASIHHSSWNEIYKFATDYYSKLTRHQHFDIEHKALVEYARSHSDFMFLHRRDDIGIPQIDSIQDILGDDQFNNFVIDNGGHFNILGANWQASYIKSLLL